MPLPAPAARAIPSPIPLPRTSATCSRTCCTSARAVCGQARGAHDQRRAHSCHWLPRPSWRLPHFQSSERACEFFGISNTASIATSMRPRRRPATSRHSPGLPSPFGREFWKARIQDRAAWEVPYNRCHWYFERMEQNGVEQGIMHRSRIDSGNWWTCCTACSMRVKTTCFR